MFCLFVEASRASESSYNTVSEDECGACTPVQNVCPDDDIQTITIPEDENFTDSIRTDKSDKCCSNHDSNDPVDSRQSVEGALVHGLHLPLSDDDEFYSLLPDGALDLPSARAGSQDIEYSSDASGHTGSSCTSKQKQFISSADNESNSDGFTSTEFYIDESLPSSITDSLPLKKLHELQILLQEKSTMLDSKETEINKNLEIIMALRTKIDKSDEKNKCMQKVLGQSLTNMKSSIKNLDEQIKNNLVDVASWMKSTTNQIVTKINEFGENKALMTEAKLTSMENDHKIVIEEMKDKLMKRIHSLEKIQFQLQQQSANLVEEKHEKENIIKEHEKKMEELNAEHLTLIDDVQKKMILEQELELEYIREDHQKELATYETQLEITSNEMSEATEKLRNMEKVAETSIEDMRTYFQQEKDEMMKGERRNRIWGNKNNFYMFLIADFRDEHELTIENLNQDHKKELHKCICELKIEIEKRHQEELETTQEQVL